MITVRVGSRTERLVERAARQRGQTKSDFVRDAVTQLLDRESGAKNRARPYDLMRHLIGSLDSGGMNLSRDTGRKFAELLQKRRAARARNPR